MYVKYGALNDYIVEEGASGIWTYRKWASGIAECWGTSGNVAVTISNAWGSIYYRPDAIPSYSFPFTFVDIPIINVTPRKSGTVNYWAFSGTEATAAKTAPDTVACPLSTGATIKVDFYVIGRWK